MKENHVHRINLFTNINLRVSQFRCEICFKFFNRLQAIDYIDRTFGEDWIREWNRLKSIYEVFKLKTKNFRLYGNIIEFESKDKYIKVSEVLKVLENLKNF